MEAWRKHQLQHSASSYTVIFPISAVHSGLAYVKDINVRRRIRYTDQYISTILTTRGGSKHKARRSNMTVYNLFQIKLERVSECLHIVQKLRGLKYQEINKVSERTREFTERLEDNDSLQLDFKNIKFHFFYFISLLFCIE